MKYFLSLTIVFLMSCNSTSKAINATKFPSGKYQVVSLHIDTYKPQKDYTLSVNSETNSIGGTFDCNTFSVDYEINEDTLKFGYAIATKMYCEDNMHNENAFFQATQSISSYVYNKGRLTFYNDLKDVVLELKFLENE